MLHWNGHIDKLCVRVLCQTIPLECLQLDLHHEVDNTILTAASAVQLRTAHM